MKNARALLAVLVSLVAVRGESAIVADGEEILVAAYTTGSQQRPTIAAGSDGSFLVVWQDERPDTPGTHIRGRRFDASGALLGTEFQIDGAGVSINTQPQVVATGEDRFVVVWKREILAETAQSLVALRLDEEGTAVGTEFQINMPRGILLDYYLSAPRATFAGDGGFVVTWASGTRNGYPDSEIFARRFDADGNATTDDKLVSSDDPALSRIRPDVTTLTNGSFVVVWAEGTYDDGPYFYTRARRLDAGGTPAAENFLVGAHGYRGPHTAAYRDGFRVVWSDFYFENVDAQHGGNLRARTFDGEGNALDEGFIVNSPATGTWGYGYPRIPTAGFRGFAAGPAADDRFVVVWTSHVGYRYGGSSDGDDVGIFGRAFESDGDADGPERQINETFVGDQQRPELAFADPQEFVVVYESSGDVFARPFAVITPECGDADQNAVVIASDALLALQTGVGSATCEICLCDANGSGTVTAGDALIILKDGVGEPVELACPACPTDTSFFLETDAPCYGAHVVVPAEVLAEGITETCEPSTAITFNGCTSSLSSQEGALVYDARGCFLEDNAALFSCDLGLIQAQAMHAAATVACGCGCAVSCPTAPGMCISVDGDAECDFFPAEVTDRAGVASPAQAGAATTVATTLAQPQSTVTSSTTCGTCCDVINQVTLALTDTVTITELLVRVASEDDPSCPDDVLCDDLASGEGPGTAKLLEDGSIEVCLSDPEGVAGPTDLLRCDWLMGFVGETGPAEVLRALDENLESIDPPPQVVVE